MVDTFGTRKNALFLNMAIYVELVYSPFQVFSIELTNLNKSQIY